MCAPETFDELDISEALLPLAYVNFNAHDAHERTCAKEDASHPGATETFTERAYADVRLTLPLDELWRARDLSEYEDFTWVFVGTSSGVMRMYPGAQLARSYNPTVRPWYFASVTNKAVISVTAPYIDATGTGVITSLAKAIFEGAGACNATTGSNAGCTCSAVGGAAGCDSGVCRRGVCTQERVEVRRCCL